MPLAPGPYHSITTATGDTAPFYALRYDRRGQTTSPLTQQHLSDQLATGGFTDVFLFSHGWNNDWAEAIDRYSRFTKQFTSLRSAHGLDFGGREFRPLLAGVIWPSTALVLPWEQGPEFAGDDGDIAADAVDQSLIAELAEDVAPENRGRYYALVEEQTLTAKDARELVELTSGVSASGDPDLDSDPGRDADESLASWAMLEAAMVGPALPSDPTDFGAVGAPSNSGPQAAGFLDKLDPRNLVRGLTVFKMKDRAGCVGTDGVGPALREMLRATDGSATRFHLVGHSYGARLLLASLVEQTRPVNSLLLLQPAVNHLCFADRLDGGQKGGFRSVLGKVSQPIMATFSSHDFPLHDVFHLALRRGKDVGEIEFAAAQPPNRYAALGGYGPRGFADWKEVPIKDPLDSYDLSKPDCRVLAIHGDRRIRGHSDVINDATAWALYNLAEA